MMKAKKATVSAFLCFMLCSLPAYSDTGKEFVIGFGTSSFSLNPYRSIYAHEMQLHTGLYEGLFSYDPSTLDPVPALAESYSKSDDGLSWTFSIRKNAKWSDGSAITADDFVASWTYLLDPKTEAEYAVFLDIIKGAKDYRAGKTDRRQLGIKAKDANTLLVELENPAPYFTKLLCHSAFVVLHSSMLYKHDWAAYGLVVNGPYIISSVDEDSLLLDKNPYYWDKSSVSIEHIRFLFMDDEEENTRLYNQGGIHWLMDSGDLDQIANSYDIHFAPMFATAYYFWNSSIKPWNDARIRRALAMLIPWDRIRSEARYSMPTNTLILPFSGYKSPAGINTMNEQIALRLLAQAGYPKGKGLPAVRIFYYPSSSQMENMDIIEEAWAKHGIKLERFEAPPAYSIREYRKNDFDLSFTSWIGDFADPIAFLLMWLSSSGLNESFYKSMEYDNLIAQSMLEEGQSRMNTLAKAENKLLNDAVIMPIYHSLSFNIIDTDYITGWYVNPLDLHPLKNLGFGLPKAKPFVALGKPAQAESGTR
ncbi:peptide ABC transporter substrate-binding protein [Spirochaetota bacterium]